MAAESGTAAAVTTEQTATPKPDEQTKSAQNADAAPEKPAEEEKPQVKKVQQLRQLLANKRAQREANAVSAAEQRGTQTKAQREESAAKPKAKAEDKPEPKEPAKAKDEKPASPERDETGRFVGKDGPKPKPAEKETEELPPAAAKKPEPTAAEQRIEAKVEKLEDAGGKAPEQGANESDKRYEARITRLLLDAKEKDAKLREAETKRVAAEEKARKVDEHAKLLERVKGADIDEDAFEQLTGRNFEQLVKDIASGKAKYRPKVKLPPEMQRLQDELNQTLAKAKQREDAQAAKEREEAEERERVAADERETKNREIETETCREWIEQNADTYPQLSGLKGSASKFLQRWYAAWEDATRDPKTRRPTWAADKQPTMESVAKSMEDSLSGEVSSILSSERSLKAALKDPQTRERVVQALKATEPSQQIQSPHREQKGNQTAASDGPRTLSKKVTQEVPVLSDRPPSADERRAAQLERLQRWKASRGISAR